MNGQEFVEAVRVVVRDSAIKGVVKKLIKPPGRKVPSTLKDRSTWFNELSDHDKKMIEGIVADSVDEALFGFFCVLDGVRVIEDGPERGQIILAYRRNGVDVRINDPVHLYLHDLFNVRPE